ncbi:MAG: response regulator [candidate division Zixibacteria bacterium]|nr:response regulator [candidate division Zixibacteria bacterium]
MNKTMAADLQKLAEKARERGRAFRVLIVDDETWVRDVFRDFCRLTNAFEIDLADSGSEAIAKAEQTAYDLITMDLIMPEVSGLDALIQIKQNSPRVPVMVITGNATDRLVKEAGVQGACRVLYKPIMLDEFIAEVATTLT